MFKTKQFSFATAFILATAFAVPAIATDGATEGDYESKGRQYAKKAASYLPNNQLTIASGVEVVADSYKDTIASALTSVATSVVSLGEKLAENETISDAIKAVPLGTIGEGFVSYGQPVVKFAVATAIHNTTHGVNTALGNEEPITWKARLVNAGRTAGAVGIMHYAAPVVQTFGEEMIKTYISASLSSMAQNVGIPLTSEMVNDFAPYAVKAAVVGGSVAVSRLMTWCSQRFLGAKSTAAKKKKD